MSTEFKGMRYYDSKQLEWSLVVCPLDVALEQEEDMKKLINYYNDAQIALAGYIKELISLQHSLRVRMEERMREADIEAQYSPL